MGRHPSEQLQRVIMLAATGLHVVGANGQVQCQ